ncbi:MAG: carbohydrate deacetylase [Beijerinckiaceae bacterium]
MKRIIINADDLGYSKAVNAKIFEFIENGKVTSSTLIMNAPDVEAAVRELRHHNCASFGVHLNVTEFRPLTPHPRQAALCNDAGEFEAKRIFNTAITSQARRAIFIEWCGQVQRALDLGVPVSHLDAHHHAHTVPRLFPVLKRVQKEFGIRRVRLTRNMTDPDERLRFGLLQAKVAWNFALRNIYRTSTTDYFTSFLTFYRRSRADIPWNGTIELMCHPANPLFDEETKLIETDWHMAVVQQGKIINYNDI